MCHVLTNIGHIMIFNCYRKSYYKEHIIAKSMITSLLTNKEFSYIKLYSYIKYLSMKITKCITKDFIQENWLK